MKNTLLDCPFCEGKHDILPTPDSKDPNFYLGYSEYYLGLAHQRDTGELLLYDGYSWLTPVQSGLPEDYKAVKVFDFPFKLNAGDYIWYPASHRRSSTWKRLKDRLEVGESESGESCGMIFGVKNS